MMKLMKRPLPVCLPLVLALVLPRAAVLGDIVNPSFETGDFTGWRQSILAPDGFVIAGDGGSDGDHYLSATVEWVLFPPIPGVGGLSAWHWQAGASQVIDIPAWATALCVDVRADGCDQWGVAMTQTLSDSLVRFIALIHPAHTPSSPAANGFTRYTVDVSAAAGLQDVSLSVAASGTADTVPPHPVEVSVDNFQFVPEPAAAVLLATSAAILFHARQRPGGPRRSRLPAR